MVKRERRKEGKKERKKERNTNLFKKKKTKMAALQLPQSWRGITLVTLKS